MKDVNVHVHTSVIRNKKPLGKDRISWTEKPRDQAMQDEW